MTSEDGSVHIVYNGETYELQRTNDAASSRRGTRFRSSSDTEVGAASRTSRRGRLSGAAARHVRPRHLRQASRLGKGRKRLVLARDHFGIKPLLMARHDGRLLFASELKALLAAGVPATVDPESLRLLLATGSVPQPRTLIAGVRALLPAHRLVADGAGVVRIGALLAARNRPPPRRCASRPTRRSGRPSPGGRRVAAPAARERRARWARF